MKVNNEIAQTIVAECMSSMEDPNVVDAIVSVHNGETRTKDAQIVAECLKRVLPNITADEYVRACSDVLRWYIDGECLDCDAEFLCKACSSSLS